MQSLRAIVEATAWMMLASSSVAVASTEPAASTANKSSDSREITDAGVADAAPRARAESISPLEQSFKATANQIEDLLGGRLNRAIEAEQLFPIAIHDEAVVQLEAKRLELLLGAADAGAERDAGMAAPLKEREPSALESRLLLDAARLKFYRLPPSERARLLSAHQARGQSAREVLAEQKLSQAQRRSQEAEQQRKRALESAKIARTEALRLVAEEHARLLAIAQQQATFDAKLVKERQRLTEERESMLKWQRRVHETQAAASAHRLNSAAVDNIYADLRGALRAARDALAQSLVELSTDSQVPNAGEDRLSALPSEVDARAPRATRRELIAEAHRLEVLEKEFRIDAARIRYERIVTLNKERLALYPLLSAEKRGAVVGFGPLGLDQARAEMRQVVLVLEYHAQATTRWLKSLKTPGGSRNQSALAATMIALKWLVPIAIFVWWRRRAPRKLSEWLEAAREERRRLQRALPTPLEQVLGFVCRVRRPLEWLLLLIAVVSLLPHEAQGLLEVSLLTTVFGWTLGGAAVVATIDALAERESSSSVRVSRQLTGHLRLRSLRLIGRMIVAVALVLSLSKQLVGKGTLYDWVLSTCWFAAIPLTLIIVRWWRGIIFGRFALKRKKESFDAWALRHQSGWESMPVALIAGCYLLAHGALRAVRNWASGFDLTRRVLAYLFRRDMSKRIEAKALELRPLPSHVYSALGPELPSQQLVPSVADAQVDEVIARINAAGGGVFAIVGERGAGKTTLLRRIQASCKDVDFVECPFDGVQHFESAFATAVHADPNSSLEQSAALVDNSGSDPGLLIDDAHRLIRPMMGGLAAFDRVLALARANSTHCSWIFAFDEVIWRFFQRARGARPLFDDVIRLAPWREEGVARLLISRSSEAKLDVSFHPLLEDIPGNADELDLQEAIERVSSAYYRLIWDYAGGNPGVALHTFRNCVGLLPDGEPAVTVFRSPDELELELLPDSAVFVLRAVVQLELAQPEDIARVTMLRPPEVLDALRYGVARGYFEKHASRYRLTWAWFRPITRFLQRRHLVVST